MCAAASPAHRRARLSRVALVSALFAELCFAAPPAPRSIVNARAPQIARADLNAAPINLRNLRGKVVLLNFWATWCAPCLVEMPVFNTWQQKYGPQGFQIIGISMDDDAAPVRKLVVRLKPTYPIAMGDAKLGAQYGGVMGLPLTYLIDRHGIVRARFQGEADISTIEKQLKSMLEK